jgi:hypothetical protein
MFVLSIADIDGGAAFAGAIPIQTTPAITAVLNTRVRIDFASLTLKPEHRRHDTLAVTGTPQKSAGEVKSDAALFLPGSVRWLSVAVAVPAVNPAVNPTGVAIGADMAATVIAAMIGVAVAVVPIAVVAIAAVAIISVAIISMAICTPMMSAVDASNAPGC